MYNNHAERCCLSEAVSFLRCGDSADPLTKLANMWRDINRRLADAAQPMHGVQHAHASLASSYTFEQTPPLSQQHSYSNTAYAAGNSDAGFTQEGPSSAKDRPRLDNSRNDSIRATDLQALQNTHRLCRALEVSRVVAGRSSSPFYTAADSFAVGQWLGHVVCVTSEATSQVLC